MGYMSELESTSGERMDAKVPRTAKPGETLEVRYDLERVKREVSPRDIEQGPANLWRYAPRSMKATRRFCRHRGSRASSD
jgi:hypothetical protein